MEGKHEGNKQKNKRKAFFKVFCIFADSWVLPWPLDRERRTSTFCKHYLVFAIFKPPPVSYRSYEHIHLILHEICSAACVHTRLSLFSLGYWDRHAIIGITYSKGITTATVAAAAAAIANGGVNSDSGPGVVIRVVGRGRGCGWGLRGSNWCVRALATRWWWGCWPWLVDAGWGPSGSREHFPNIF